MSCFYRGRSSSAVYVDGVYLARPVMVMGDFLDLDLERVEVLQGPSRHVIRSQCGRRRPECRQQDAFEPGRDLGQVRGR